MLNANDGRALRSRNSVHEKAPTCVPQAGAPDAPFAVLPARVRPASAAVAGLATLARDLALLGRIHRRKTTLRTAAPRCCHFILLIVLAAVQRDLGTAVHKADRD